MKTIGGEPVSGTGAKTERMSIVMEPADMERIDAFANRHGFRSRGSAVRALTRIGLEAFEAEGRTEGGAQG